ncbi:amidohydrolase [Jatrophihabitans lederbergiae]|uniref:Amidohydrolase n=1 Tax=Jatrophihabitans lederbergiae TaxID=3075547 RepID=A0ABU2JB07_9ACTN|nr:amidohydrolase [Jatrophihabitans sp. DSM 44399]MDT0261913.1 amidohydrolase [Jatrophihabitans sp. DSM 44399]
MATLHDHAVDWLAGNDAELVNWRRDLHAHPEIAYAEHRTTERIVALLTSFGLEPKPLSIGTGVVCDIGAGPEFVALRADIDALPLPDSKTVEYASQNPGSCHACGHDAHTAILLGVAATLARAQPLAGSVRLIFQPAEERMPGGAEAVVDEGGLAGVSSMFALHCDPKLDAGQVGLRVGPITASFNQIEIRLSGPGGHTARPHLTVDVVYALGKLITELPGLLSRRVDPRSAVSLVWGAVNAGAAANAIPPTGILRGTLRMLDGQLWNQLEGVVRELAEQTVAATNVKIEIDYDSGVPAVTNDGALVAIQTRAALAAFGPHAVSDTPQSMGGEDFAWYLQTVPGSLARLGVRSPGGQSGDLHQSSFDIDEDALAVGVRFTTAILDQLFDEAAAESPSAD